MHYKNRETALVIGNLISLHRHKMAIGPRELARLLGYKSPGKIHHLVRGRHYVSLHDAVRLEQALEIDGRELVRLTLCQYAPEATVDEALQSVCRSCPNRVSTRGADLDTGKSSKKNKKHRKKEKRKEKREAKVGPGSEALRENK